MTATLGAAAALGAAPTRDTFDCQGSKRVLFETDGRANASTSTRLRTSRRLRETTVVLFLLLKKRESIRASPLQVACNRPASFSCIPWLDSATDVFVFVSEY